MTWVRTCGLTKALGKSLSRDPSSATASVLTLSTTMLSSPPVTSLLLSKLITLNSKHKQSVVTFMNVQNQELLKLIFYNSFMACVLIFYYGFKLIG